jgi:tetratricopeptide (TPR) repeat protein
MTRKIITGVLFFSLALFSFTCLPIWGREDQSDADQIAREKQEKNDEFIRQKIGILREMASTYLESQKHDQALETMQKLIDFPFPAETSPEVIAEHEKSKVELLQQMAGVHLWEKKDPKAAIPLMEKALAQVETWDASDTTTKSVKMDLYKNLGNAYRELKQLDKALECLKKAEEIQ